MPPKKCSMKVPPEQREEPHKCLQKGIGLGLILSKRFPTKQADLEQKGLRELGEMARVLGMRNYSRARKAEIVAWMMDNISKIREHNRNIMAPRRQS